MGKQISYLAILVTMAITLHADVVLATEGQPDAPTSSHKIPHYSLVMSEDDAVCKPLADLYNQLLDKQAQDKTNTKHLRLYTNFERREPGRFAAIGFVEPPKKEIVIRNIANKFIDNPSPPRGTHAVEVYLADLFDEGKPREVSIYDMGIGRGSVTQIKILKKDAEYREIQTNIVSLEIDPDVVDRDGGYRGLHESQVDMKKHSLGYYLTKWPNFDKFYAAFLAQDEAFHAHANSVPPKFLFPPMIYDSTVFISTRLFLHNNHPYFILNQYTAWPGRDDSNVVVYELTPSRHEDTCYITLPGEEAAARQQANGGE